MPLRTFRIHECAEQLASRNAYFQQCEVKISSLQREIDDLNKAHERDQLAAEQQNKAVVDVKKLRLQRGINKLNAQRDTHIAMLGAARECIEKLKAKAKNLRTKSGNLQTLIAQLEAATSDTIPNTLFTPFLRVYTTLRLPQQPDSVLLLPLLLMPRSLGANAYSFALATLLFALL